ncbi:cell surface protein, partial [Listeria monocytogenes]|nr:cell surface protein [Listeria monocytogenes]
MKKTCLFFLICVCLSVIVIPGINVHAAAKINSWDLVDSGKHLDYDGNSKYMSYIKSGAATWNSYKKGVIRPDSPKVLEDVFCNDTSANNYVNATTYSNGKITFNKKNMDKKMLQGKR